MPKLFLHILVFLLTTSLYSQSADVWNSLAMVVTHREYDELMGMEVQKSIPLQPALDLNGTEIEISGYMIALTPLVKKQSHIMFSKFPQNMCFFCGAAGPESAMQVFFKEKVQFQKEKVKLRGTLQIQKNDASGLIYFLQNAQVVKN